MYTIYVSENPGLKRNRPELLEVNAKTILALPDFFTLDLTIQARRVSQAT